MSQLVSDRNLLFGIIALQMDLITRDRLVAAMHAWVVEKQKSLGQILVDQGGMSLDEHALLEALVAKHVERHCGNAAQSLASLSPVNWIKHDLQSIADPGLEVSLRRLADLGTQTDGDTASTASYPSGDSGSHSRRFRVLRPHARGGQGEVFVARDTELNREVALKQLQANHADHPATRARFLLEAEVTGGLEHPGIVPVYSLGHFDDGRPFYAMRFIRGDSLKDAIAQFHHADDMIRDPGERSLALRHLLRRFVDVCNALAYAHSRGVLHRDLKPGNIMLGSYGETLVVDWGLAKPMAAEMGLPRSNESTLRPSPVDGMISTVTGAAVGTPAYMSPEQAAGRVHQLGSASDVYSLGATLYCLLTGRAPFTERDVATLTRQVERGEFLPPRQVLRSVDPALEAICLKAMSVEPTNRYPDARRLADDVERWLADEPVTVWREPWPIRARRWIRRHRTLATAGAIATLVGLTALAIAYSRESAINRRLAHTNRALDQANGTITATNIELRNANTRVSRAKADSDRRLDQTLAAIENYYSGVAKEVLLGQKEFQSLRQRLLEKPREFYEQLARELESNDAPDDRLTELLGKAHLGLARISQAIGNTPQALLQCEKAIKYRRSLAVAYPESATYQFALADGLDFLGIFQRSGKDPHAAIAPFLEAIGILSRLTADHPQVRDYAHILRSTYADLGVSRMELGEMQLATDNLNQAIAIGTTLLESQPNDPRLLEGLARSYNSLGNLRFQLGDSTATAVMEKAVALFTRLSAARPDDPSAKSRLAASYLNLGVGQKNGGRPLAAETSELAAINVLSELTVAQPNVPAYEKSLAFAYGNLGLVQRNLGDNKAAALSQRQAIAILSKLSATHKDVPEYEYELASCYQALGIEQMLMKELGNAAESERQAISLYQRLAETYPKVPRHRSAAAMAYAVLGEILRQSLDLQGAAASHRQAIDGFTRLLTEYADNVLFLEYIAGSWNNLAMVQYDAKDLTASLESFRAAIALWTKLLASGRNSANVQSGIGESLSSESEVLQALGRYREAEEAIRQAVIHARAAHEKAPEVPSLRLQASRALQSLAKIVRAQNRPEEAARIARERKTVAANDADQLYEIARDFAACVPAVGDAAVKESLADETIEALRAAAVAGWSDAVRTGREPAFQPLGRRDDFRRLIAELFDRVFPLNPFVK